MLRLEKELKRKEEEKQRLQKEARAAELKRLQMEQRKADEFSRHQKARNIIEENRIRVALQSELVGNGDYLDQEYKDQINCILGDQFGSIEEKIKVINAQQSLIQNNEEHLLMQMELDTAKGIQVFKEEEARQKIRDERKLVDEIYKQYLV